MQKRNILTFLMLLFFSIATSVALAQTVVTAANGTEFANYMTAAANYTIRVTANISFNTYIRVPEGYTKTLVGWDASTGATTRRTITRSGTDGTIDVDGTLNIQNITFHGGTSINCGYPMVTNFGTTTMNNVTIQNCYSTATSGCAFLSYGGARVTTSGTVSITNNRSAGAPFDLQGPSTKTTFTNSGTLTVSNNTYTVSNQHTGGIQLSYCNATNTGTITVTDNSASYTCGGLTINSGTVFTNSGTVIVSNNTSTQTGGGIWIKGTFNQNKTLTVSGNKGTAGGGIAVSPGGTMTCGSGSTTTISGNTATGTGSCGGGIYVWSGGTCNLANTTINGSNKAVYGAGIFNEGTLRFQTAACTISGNEASSIGGGLFLNPGGTVAFNISTTISGNTAVDGAGGVFLQANATFPSTVSITNNNGGANGAGGGVYVDQGVSMTATGVTISGNTAGEGGGIANDGTLLCTGTNTITVTGNSATDGDGGGILNYTSGTLTLSSTAAKTITGNTASGNGGGILTANGGTLTNCNVGASGAANSAANGGGIYLGGGTLNVTDGSCTYNTATANGGGAYINAGAAMQVDGNGTDGVLIKYNHAGQHGGGVYKLGTLKVQGLVDVTENTVDAK